MTINAGKGGINPRIGHRIDIDIVYNDDFSDFYRFYPFNESFFGITVIVSHKIRARSRQK